jgi:hypothetical protein
MSSHSPSWPLLEARGPFATAAPAHRGQKRPRSAWLLTGLAFLSGGLVSAAVFSIGWRHQAQRGTAAQAALAAATARTHRLERRLGALRTSLGEARGAAARAEASAKAATASEQALAQAATRVGEEATAASGNGTAVSAGAGTLTATATRIASELKTLDTYFTTTPAGQLDPGYIANQTSYLSRQLVRLQADAGTIDTSVASFQATLSRLGRDAQALKSR